MMLLKTLIKKRCLDHGQWRAYLILFAALSLTVSLSFDAKQHAEDIAKDRFFIICDKLALKIQERLNTYALILKAGAGMYEAADEVNRQAWRTYVTKLDIDRKMPGVLGLGFAQIIYPHQLKAHTAAIRLEGYANYEVHPVGERDMYSSIIYLEPFTGRNLRAFGYDMWSEPVRRAAMMQARDTGEASLSGKVKLVQETEQDVQAGVLMYVPVYRHGALTNTIEQRREAIIGWVYSPYRMIDLTLAILDDKHNPELAAVALHIFDGPQPASSTMLFDKTYHSPADNSFLYHQNQINFNGKTWLLTFDTQDRLYQPDYTITWLILLGGLVLSSLLFSLMLAMTNTRATAKRIAQQQTLEIVNSKMLLEQSEFRWHFALEGAGDGLWDWDLAHGKVYYSKCWKEMLGYSNEEVGAGIEEWEKRIHPEDRQAALATAQAYMEGKLNSYFIEHRLKCKDGDYKWIVSRGMIVERDEAGKPLRMIGTHADITKRKQMELMLAEYNQDLALIFDLSPEGIIFFDGMKRVRHVNKAFERLTGLKANEVLGLDEATFSDLFRQRCSPKTAFPGIAELRLIQQATKKVKSKQLKVKIDAPSKPILEVSLLEADIGDISQMLHLRNITHETEVDRMKSEFLSTAAHELRTPMSSIYGYAELLVTQDLTADEKDEFLKIILAESKIMATILNDLLDLARIEARLAVDFVMARIDVYALIHEVAANLAVAHDRAPPVILAKKQAVWINADRAKMIQVMNNVLSNAYKYSPKGGVVTIDVVTPSASIQSSLGIHADYIGIRVTDEGLGMTPEQLTHVFERFYRADTSGKILGTGLGLSIVKEIVSLHHGDVSIDSVIGKGSALTIWLPRALQIQS